MSYQVIARKWRPQRFSDMVGQEHIARTLRNAVISGRVAHAYLFVGPRGIGKTTSARIFAKAINCVHPVDGEPCCQCTSCKAIADESSVDVIEIDAATHTQVEKAREICEDVLHLPISSKYKIYIIDEVHMLSKSAWNALLKTIEEPPAHAKFIFATTEVNKVLPTVISRCQRFDLRRIPSTAIAGRLRAIADAENVNISDSAINVIAHAADGGMRDAQSLLDQLISFFGADSNRISEEQAFSLFGLTAPAEMEALMNAVIANDRESAIISIHKFAAQGKNLETLFEEMNAWLRGILLCRILRSPQAVLEESPEKIEVFKKLAAKVDPAVIQRLIEIFSASGYMLREAINKQVFMESILLKGMRQAHSVQVESLIARLNQIRKSGELSALESVVPLYELPPGQIVTTADSGFASTRSGEQTAVADTEIKEQKQPPKQQSVSSPASPEDIKKNEAPPPSESLKNAARAETSANPENTSEELAENFTDEPDSTEESEHSPAEVSQEESTTADEDILPTDSADERKAPPENVLRPNELWQKLIMDISDNLKKITLAALMEDGTPETIDKSTLVVAFDSEYEEVQRLCVEKELSLLTMRLRSVTGDPNAVLTLVRRTGIATPAQVKEKMSAEEMKKRAAADPFVQQTMNLFSGHLVDAYALDESGNIPE